MVRPLIIAFVLAFICAAAAHAQTEPSPGPSPASESAVPTDDQWHYAVTPYIWVPNIHATVNLTTPGIITNSPVNVSVVVVPGQYLPGLNFAIMGAFEARRKGTSILVDYINLNVGSSASSIALITGPGGRVEIPISSSVNTHLFTGVSTLAVGLTAYATHTSNVDVILGERTISSRVVADYSITGPLMQISRTGSLSRTVFLMDPIIGIKGRIGLARRWYVPFEGDVGAGADNTTVQYLGGLAFAGRTNDVIAGYRVLGYNQTGTQLLQHLWLSGPYVGLRIHW
jgi:hypothetical protein